MAFSYRKLIPYGSMATSVLTRVLPHPPNFTATNSTMVYGNSVLKPWWNFFVPILLFFISDVINHFVKELTPIFGTFCYYTYPCYIVTSLVSRFLTYTDRKLNHKKSVVLVFLSSFIFYIITNLGVYLTGRAYDNRTLARVYFDGIPFFGWELFGNLTYSFLFFAIHLKFVETPENEVSDIKEIENADEKIDYSNNDIKKEDELKTQFIKSNDNFDSQV